MKADIHAVANYCNVSKSTVSRVINNNPSVSEKTRKKVLEAINILGYYPNKLARGLSSDGYDAILIVYTRPSKDVIDNPYFSQIIHTIGSISEEYNYDLILQSTSNREREISKTLSMVRDRLIKGIVLLSSRVDDSLIHALSKETIPVIVIGKLPKGLNASNIISVDTDNFKDCMEIGNYLVKMGHRKIGCIHAPKEYNVSLERINGFIQSLKNNNIDISSNCFVDGGYTLDSAYEAAINLLSNNKLTAIFATDDLKSLAIYKAAKNLNISIPHELSIVGHNDYEFSTLLSPSLTTVHVPIDKLGLVTANKLFNMIKNPNTKESHILIDTDLIIRSSVEKIHP